MKHINLITRRSFLGHSIKTGTLAALASLSGIPLLLKSALAGGIGANGKKFIFIFLRGANDGLNSVIPIRDSAYSLQNRPDIFIPGDSGTNYATRGPCDFPIASLPSEPTYRYSNAIRLGNGFAALHPSLKFLAPVYNAGDLAIVHRVGYPAQSRSHFDSQNFWETGSPNTVANDGMLYRAMVESGLAFKEPLSAVSVQSSLPLLLRGSNAALTNLTNPNRYKLLGVPNTDAGKNIAKAAVTEANGFPTTPKDNRDLLRLQYQNLVDTQFLFEGIDFSETGNTFVDDQNTNADTAPYNLFPTINEKNGGYVLHASNPDKYVVDDGSYEFFTNLKAAALVLNKTNAVISGTEMDGFDTHSVQGGVTGAHASLLRRVGWAIYALRKYFIRYADKVQWKDVVVVTLSEFGRTTIQNESRGTDHAEAGVMFVAGGGINGYNQLSGASGVYGCNPADAYNSWSLPWLTGPSGSMLLVEDRYLQRAIDYRSVFGELLRRHLGVTATQLQAIIPGYADSTEHLSAGGTAPDGTPIAGELGLVRAS